MRLVLGFLLFISLPFYYAQKDSSNAFRFSGIQAEFGAIGGHKINPLRHSSVSEQIPPSSALHKDLKTYTSSVGYVFSNMPPTWILISIKCFGELSFGRDKKLEMSAGLRMGNGLLSSAYYHKSTIVGYYVYPSIPTKDTILRTYYRDTSYSFNIIARQVYLPLSVYLNTNKLNRFWFGFGFEISPYLSLNNRLFENSLTSELYREYSKKIAESEDWESKYPYYTQNNNTQTIHKLKGTGFGFYTAIPLSLNLRLNKKVNVLKNICFNLTLMPTYNYHQFAPAGTSSGFSTSASLGLRYSVL